MYHKVFCYVETTQDVGTATRTKEALPTGLYETESQEKVVLLFSFTVCQDEKQYQVKGSLPF